MWCLSNDPCGITCAIITHCLILFGNFAMIYGVLVPWYGWTAPAALHYTIFAIISVLASSSHLRAMCTNPGAVPLHCPLPPTVDESKRPVPICHRCDGYKPPRAHHCSQCNRCILKMDHHCPWVNNCVGQNNQKHFVLFLCYTLTLSAYALSLLAMRAASSVSSMDVQKRGSPAAILRPAHGMRHPIDDAGPVLVNCFLFFESILFGLFTAAMLTDQLTSILNDTTAIERLKREDAPAHGHRAGAQEDSCLYALSETFGRPCSLMWLVPVSVRFNGMTYEQLSTSEFGCVDSGSYHGGSGHHEGCQHRGRALSPRSATYGRPRDHSAGSYDDDDEYLDDDLVHRDHGDTDDDGRGSLRRGSSGGEDVAADRGVLPAGDPDLRSMGLAPRHTAHAVVPNSDTGELLGPRGARHLADL
mmetsp:Transcript_25400/g.74577  ORF Transcript_25400/g.74577 Transcript_25400/m.74577 type:complete len:416 (-) Transcript_25400:325-1572(-)